MRREPADKAADEKEWQEDIASELAELQEDAEEDYMRRLAEYKAKLEAWQKQKQAKVSPLGPHRHRVEHNSFTGTHIRKFY